MLEKLEIQKNDEPCPVEAIAAIIGQKWVSQIVRDLALGERRFGELQHSIGVSPRVLSARLQGLEMQGLVHRAVFAEVPPRTEYSLTEKGQLLIPVIEEMRTIGKHFL